MESLETFYYMNPSNMTQLCGETGENAASWLQFVQQQLKPHQSTPKWSQSYLSIIKISERGFWLVVLSGWLVGWFLRSFFMQEQSTAPSRLDLCSATASRTGASLAQTPLPIALLMKGSLQTLRRVQGAVLSTQHLLGVAEGRNCHLQAEVSPRGLLGSICKLCHTKVRHSASSVPVPLTAHFSRGHLKDFI